MSCSKLGKVNMAKNVDKASGIDIQSLVRLELLGGIPYELNWTVQHMERSVGVHQECKAAAASVEESAWCSSALLVFKGTIYTAGFLCKIKLQNFVKHECDQRKFISAVPLFITRAYIVHEILLLIPTTMTWTNRTGWSLVPFCFKCRILASNITKFAECCTIDYGTARWKVQSEHARKKEVT